MPAVSKLLTRAGDLADQIRNVAVTMHFGTNDKDEIDLISSISGERSELRTSTTEGSSSSVTSESSSSYTSGYSTSGPYSFDSDRFSSSSTYGSTSGGTNGVNESTTLHETIVPRLKRHELLKAWSHGQFVLWVHQGSGFTQFDGLPILVQGMHVMSRREYKRRERYPWPTLYFNQTPQPTPKELFNHGPAPEHMSKIISKLFDVEDGDS